MKIIPKSILEYGKNTINVLDLFGGSGSTLIACEKINRKCYMMEISAHYCDIIVARWEKFTGKKAVKCQ
jgi:DNA modification methylase